MSSTPKPLTFSYFKYRARAESARALMSLAGDQCDCKEDAYDTPFFEEEHGRVWAEKKKSLPFHKVPVLKVQRSDGTRVTIPETAAVTGLLARRYGYAGKDEVDAAICDALTIKCNDILQSMVGAVVFQKSHTAESILKDASHGSTQGLRELEHYLKQLKSNNDSFVVGGSLSLGDLAVHFLAENYLKGIFKGAPEDAKAKKELEALAPSVAGTFHKVRALPEMRPFFNNRPF
ncbi:MAG: hypothetical protein MHM6MM_003398 [Cercozoa sp. M6MM]